jgi:UDP-N-acetylglucosamine--N-acetylmuramyl-(pentapeptide) pyrophosphoryl-undecaprenol N-acetylglucosamine transferase
MLGIPTIIHEQNVRPGLVTRLLAPRVDRVFLSFPDTAQGLNAPDASVVGVPLRDAVRRLRARSPENAKAELGIASDRPLVLGLGGSNGARAINDALLSGCDAFRDRNAHLAVIAGRDAERLKRQHPDADCTVIDHTPSIGLWMRAADVAVSRAGGATLSELVALGVPTIAVPWPDAADDHQTANARWFAERGACRWLSERDSTETKLLEETLFLLDGSADRAALRDACNRLAQTEAHDHLMREVDRYLRHDSPARVVPLYRHRRRWHERLGLAAARARALGERIGSSR